MKNLIVLLLILSNQYSEALAATTDSFALINRSRIFYHITGHGKPAFVFVSGLGEGHDTWHKVQDSIAAFAQTFSYDRAGLGKSDYHNEKKDVYAMVNELHTVTTLANIRRPFILVGHSLGCEIAKVYASVYPKDVSGIIFIDPGFNEKKLKAAIPASKWEERNQALKKYVPPFNPAQKAELKEANHSSAIADNITTLGSIPVILFTATHINPDFPASADEFKIKKQTHALWLQSLPKAQHIVTDRSRHYVQEDAPDLVIAAAKEMSSAIRGRR